MSWLQAAFIGLVEGLTEFLPVSSSAHMGFVPQLLGMPDPGPAFSAVVQLGPIIAILAYFWHDLIAYVRGILRQPNPLRISPDDTDARLGWYVILATLPILVAALLLEKKIKGVFRSLEVIAWSLIGFSAVIWVAEKIGKQTQRLEQMTLKESLGIGIAQALALVPGVSRSGATISAGLFLGMEREAAARFSFLLSVPALMMAGLYELYKDVLRSPNLGTMVGPYIVGTVVAGLSAYAVIGWFLGFIRARGMTGFILYRIAIGLLLLALLKTGTIKSSTPEEVPAPPLQEHVTMLSRKPGYPAL
jgi:undecaprenyl-diphosphatase